MKTIKETIITSLTGTSDIRRHNIDKISTILNTYSNNDLSKQWGQSGKTCQQVLDEYQQRYDEIREAIDYVNTYF